MIKRAAYYVTESFDKLNAKYNKDFHYGCEARLVGVIHDELLTYLPGDYKVVDQTVDKDGLTTYKYEFDELTHIYAKAQEEGMTRAMDEILHPLIPGFPSKADCGLGLSWAAK